MVFFETKTPCMIKHNLGLSSHALFFILTKLHMTNKDSHKNVDETHSFFISYILVLATL